MRLIHKFEAEEKQLYKDNVLDVAVESNVNLTSVPPRPVLVARTDTFMLLKPAKFKPANGEEVFHTWTSGLLSVMSQTVSQGRLAQREHGKEPTDPFLTAK